MKLEFVKRKWKLLVAMAVILAAGAAGFMLWRGRDATTAQAAVVAVKRGAIKVTVSGTGTVEPVVAQSVTSKVSGTISAINFKNGQQVKKGDLLFELNNQSLQTELEKAMLELRQAELDRQNTNSQLSQQDARAPIGGQVSGIQVSEGQDVPKGTALMTVNDTGSLIFQVPVSDPKNIKPGQKADVTILDLGTSGLPGRVEKVDRSGKANADGSRSYYITIKITNPGALTPDMKAQAVIHTTQGETWGYEAGQMKWAQVVTVRAGVSGTVRRIYVDENEYVQKGQVLAYIESESVSSQLASQGIREQQVRLNVQTIQRQLADCKIYAPIDGIITVASAQSGNGSSSARQSSSTASAESSGSNLWQIGDEVGAGQLLATIDGGTGMAVNIPVDEVDIAKVKPGQQATVTVDALPDRVFRGTVTSVGNQGVVQNNVATFDVSVSIEKPVGIKPGMTANVEIMVSSKDNVLVLPIEAVQEIRGNKYVILAQGDGNGTRIDTGRNRENAENSRPAGTRNNRNLRPVETGLNNESEIEILSGVQAGDLVVLPTVTRNSGSNNGNSGNRQSGPFGGGGGRPGGGFMLH